MANTFTFFPLKGWAHLIILLVCVTSTVMDVKLSLEHGTQLSLLSLYQQQGFYNIHGRYVYSSFFLKQLEHEILK